MSNLEHYFENLLFDGEDCYGDVNKNSLTKEEQEAVEICAQYVIWSIFDGRKEFKSFIRQEFEPIKRGKWIPSDKGDCTYTCSECGFFRDAYLLEEKAYCPHCGARMDGGENEIL